MDWTRGRMVGGGGMHWGMVHRSSVVHCAVVGGGGGREEDGGDGDETLKRGEGLLRTSLLRTVASTVKSA